MITGNEQIYPSHSGYENHANGDGVAFVTHEGGLTIRQHFAAMAMSGYISNEFTPNQNADHVAEYAVKCADALIAELNKPQSPQPE